MEKCIQIKGLSLTLFFLFFSSPLALFSQPSYPFVNEYDLSNFDYTVAYITDGPIDVDEGKVLEMPGFYYWDAMTWYTKTKQATSWTLMTSPPNPLDQGNKVLYVIPERYVGEEIVGDKVFLGESIDAKNKLTLLICGQLSLGKLTIDVPEPFVIFKSVQLGDVEESPYSLDFFAEAELPVGHSMVQVGFYISPDLIFPVDPTYKVVGDYVYDSESNQYLLSISNYGGPYENFFVDGAYKVVGYAISEYFIDGVSYQITGLSMVNSFELPLINSKRLSNSEMSYFEFPNRPLIKEKSDETGSTISMNNFELILCGPESTFFVDVLDIKNNADLTINGTFYVNTLLLNNNYCVTAGPSGVIMTPDGYAPPNIYLGNSANGCDDINEILPIELLSFVPEIKPDRIELKWTTGTEINNDYFSIERSRDMYGWEVLGFVPGAGNSSVPLSYSFSDLRPMDGLAYYRLKQTDFDGKFEYFGPIAAHYDLGMEGLDFKVLKQYTNWVIAVPNDGIYQVEVYNLMGHRLVSEKIENNLVIPAPQGAVVIRVTDGFARSASRVVM